MRYDDLMLLGGSGDFGIFAYNEQQLVSAKVTLNDMGEEMIALQFSNGLVIEITASKYGQVKYEELKIKYFRKS